MYRNKRVTKKDVADFYGVWVGRVVQIGFKQLFTVNGNLISYLTVVGRYDANSCVWELTSHKYSATTSRQLTKFKNLENVQFILIKTAFQNVLK